jgi:hypothetical protein
MKRFICWYAYQGMETEGDLVLMEPAIIKAVDIAEAMWKYHHKFTPDWGKMFYNDDLEEYRKKGEFTGWGFWCEELAN